MIENDKAFLNRDYHRYRLGCNHSRLYNLLCGERDKDKKEKQRKVVIEMAQGEFTKEEARETKKAVEEIFEAIPKSKRLNYIGHLNDVMLFLEACVRNIPEKGAKT